MKRVRVTNSNYNPCEICQQHCPYFSNHYFEPCLTVAGYNRAKLLEDMLGYEYDLENLLDKSNNMDVTIPHFNIGDMVWSICYGDRPVSFEVRSVEYRANFPESTGYYIAVDSLGQQETFYGYEIGETIFSSKSAAEKKLTTKD